MTAKLIVITGASGFVGRHLCTYARDRGFSVVALSRSGTAFEGVRNVAGVDYGDPQALSNLFAGAQAVVHLAARAHQLNEDQARAADVYRAANVELPVAVAKACKEAGVARFVLLSSIGVNGNKTTGEPFTERSTPIPVEPYAISKFAGEQAVADTLAAGQTDFVILRPPLVYGTDCPGNFRRLLNIVARLPVVPLGGVTAQRTFISIDNLTDAILVSTERPALSRRTFVVADDLSLPLSSVIALLAEGMGRSRSTVWNVRPSLLEFAAGLVGRRAALDKLTAELTVDCREFMQVAQWKPPVDARKALRETAAGFLAARATPADPRK